MEADLMDVKQLFSNMMKRVQPWILSHFIMWLDLKVAEYKVLGYMVLDKKSVYDKDLAQLVISANKTGTPSPASATSSEHMYIIPTQTTGDSANSSKNPSPNVVKESKEYDNFAELVQHNKKKSVAMGTLMTEKLNNSQKCANKSVPEKESGEDNSDIKEQDNSETKSNENGLPNQRKQRKPGKALHSIVNSLKQKTTNSEPVSNQQNGNSSEVKTDKPREIQTVNRVNGDKQTVSENSWYQIPTKVYNGKEQSLGPQEDKTGQLNKTNNREMIDSSEMEEDTPLYKSQQFSSLISLSRSRGRRRRSSNDEITYPLITVKDVDVPQMYDEEPRSQNLADFYFAQNQLDEQFAVRRARQNICRTINRHGIEIGYEKTDTVFPETANQSGIKDKGMTLPLNKGQMSLPLDKGQMSLPLDKGQMPVIKRENVETSKDEDTSSDCSRIQNENVNNSNQNHNNSNHSNTPQTVEKSGTDTPVFVKSEPQNDEDYYSANNGGQYDRLSNQSFSSDNSGYHDNSSHFEYQGDDITDESYTLNNSELYGDDYVGGTGMDHHDNKMMRQRIFKKRPLSCNQNIVPRDPSSGKFVCELCGGTFTNRSSYFRHKRIHGEKKFRCFLCDKAFHRKEHLHSHIHRHTKSFPLKCGQCHYESHSLDEATTHFQTEHNQNSNQTP